MLYALVAYLIANQMFFHNEVCAVTVVIPCRDVIAIDKKKMQEEIDSTPKPDHLAAAEKELLSYAGLKT